MYFKNILSLNSMPITPSFIIFQTLIHEGGLVPKSQYRNESIDEHDGSHHDHSGLYQTQNLTAGQIFELMIKNNDPKSVITWDFDCTKADVLFTVFHTDKELPNDLGGESLFGVFKNQP